ncbi:MAG: hypothetical protein R3C68_09040 [Myxococcota bacterium]
MPFYCSDARPVLSSLAIVVLPASTAHAANYYVAKNGGNGNPGSEAQPCGLTVQHAVNQAEAGDTVNVKAGTYRRVVLKNSGNATDGAADAAEPGINRF